MAEEPDSPVLQHLREMRGEIAALRESAEEHSELFKASRKDTRDWQENDRLRADVDRRPVSISLLVGVDMKIERAKHCLDVHKADLSGARFEDVNLSGCDFHDVNMSGCSFDDINMSGWRIHNVNLAGLRIEKANLAGAVIDGIAVTDMLEYWRAGHEAKGE